MRRYMRASVVTGITIGLGLSMLSVAWSQGSGSSRTSPSPSPRGAAPPPEEFHVKLWRFIVREQSPYTKWPSLPGKSGTLEAKSPHGPFVRLFAYKVDAKQPQNVPDGTVLVLENYAADNKTRTSIDIMYRSAGYDPAAGDWYWMEYLPTGRVAVKPQSEGGRPIVGHVKSCIECHAKAQGKDLVYSNDALPEPTNDEPKAESKSESPVQKKEKP